MKEKGDLFMFDISKPRIHENGKKSCIFHSCVTTHCGCPDSRSQSDHATVIEEVEFTAEDLKKWDFLFRPVSEPGKYTRTITYVRKGNEIKVNVSFKKQ